MGSGRHVLPLTTLSLSRIDAPFAGAPVAPLLVLEALGPTAKVIGLTAKVIGPIVNVIGPIVDNETPNAGSGSLFGHGEVVGRRPLSHPCSPTPTN